DDRDGATAAVAQGRFVTEHRRGQRQHRENHAYGDRAEQFGAVASGGDERPKRNNPSTRAVKLEAMRSIAQDVAERGAVSQYRPEVEEMSGSGRWFVRGEPKAHRQHDQWSGAGNVKSSVPAEAVGYQLRDKE